MANVVSDASQQGRDAVLRADEERVHLALTAGGMGTWEWAVDSGKVVWSPGLEEMHGLAPGTFGGRFEDFLNDVHPDDRERVAGVISAELEGGTRHDVEYRILTADGTVRWVEGKGEVFRDSEGRPVRMAGVCMDITERKRAEEAKGFIAEAMAVLASSLEYSSTLKPLADLAVSFFADWCAIDLVTEDGEISRIAEAGVQAGESPLASYSSAATEVFATGSSLFRARVSPEDSASLDPLLRWLHAAGMRSFMCVPCSAGGEVLAIISLASRSHRYSSADLNLAEDIGRRAGLSLENARLYRRSQEVQEELRRANEAKDEFLGLVSHELRTPITAIYGGARLLRSRAEQLDAESRNDLLNDIERESERMFRLVEDLLVLARTELGHQIATEPVIVARVTDKVVAAMQKRKPSRELKVDLPEELPPVDAEPTYLEQIIRNLVANADKYSPPEAPIEIVAGNEGTEVTISVLDKGPGVTEEEVEQLFDRFYRSPKTAKQAAGIGIGLTVCKRLVEAQGGRIWVRSRDEGGLAVSFTLPVFSGDE